MIKISKPDRTPVCFKPPVLKNTYLPRKHAVVIWLCFNTGLIGFFQQLWALA